MQHPMASAPKHRVLWLLCAGLLSFSLAREPITFAQEALVPASARVARLAPADMSAPLTLRMTNTGLDALRGETPLWHRSFYDIDAVASGPIQVGDGVYYTLGEHLYLLDVASGEVRGRQPLSGQVHALSLEGDHGTLVLTGGSGESAWTETCTLYPFGTDCPVRPSLSSKPASQARQEATHLITQAVKEGDPSFHAGRQQGLTLLQRPEVKARLASILPALEEAERKDVWNPWFILVQAEALTVLEQPQRAALVLERLFASRPEVESPGTAEVGSPDALRRKNGQAFALELLKLSPRLDVLDPLLGERAFQAGLASWLRQGYEPELALGIMPTLLLLGNSKTMLQAQDASEAGDASSSTTASKADPARSGWLERRAGRVWDLSPMAEGVAGFYQAIGEATAARGDMEAAASWLERSRMAAPMLHPGGPSLSQAALALEILQACLLALVLGFIVRWLACSGAGPARLLRLRRWSRAELLGMLLLQGVLLWASVTATRSISVVAMSFQAPNAMTFGAFGHPEQVAWSARGPRAPANTFLYALGLQQAGRLEEAAALYEPLSMVEATINRGICFIALNKRAEGQALLAQALELRPGDEAAAYSLGQEPKGPRVERLKRLGVSRPLLALPTPELWTQVWEERAEAATAAESGPMVPVLGLVGQLSQDSYSGLVPLGAFLAFMLAGLGMVSLFRPEVKVEAPGPISKLGRILGVLLPGTGPEWRVIGPLLSALLILLALLNVNLTRSNGEVATLLEAMVRPDFAALYGAGVPVRQGVQGILETLAPSWWAFWLGALGLSALLSWAQGTPDRGERQDASPPA